MLFWTVALIATILVLGGLFAVLLIFSLSRSATEGDLDWQITRLERKVDLILTHLGIGHDEHAPETVIGLVRADRTQEAVLVLLYRANARRNLFSRNYLRFLLFLSAPDHGEIKTTT